MLARGQVVLVDAGKRRPPFRARVEGFDTRGYYTGLQLGLSKAQRREGNIAPLRAFRPAQVLAIRVRKGFQYILPGVL